MIIIGRQTQTPLGTLDLLAIDGDGRLVVVEDKRNRTPREVLAQTIDYATWTTQRIPLTNAHARVLPPTCSQQVAHGDLKHEALAVVGRCAQMAQL